ncbi:hypothetical protein M8845_18515, partial [Gelidibacter japonicus]|uniref:hypothetical protein n=1 Tax=Gelidibacter japonicus TaxID=1962232 RepID=UPI0020206647
MYFVIFQIGANVYVYELWRVPSRTIPNGKLPVENPQDFPSTHRPSHNLYTVCVPSMGIFTLL